ncbi:esterase family protein [Nocardia sp. SYP-A9097]|uniref:alpha/beta hydrolase n=1 Tax=Nocardia sp. SYP-A9097 TaxID=2663237 RepID=UPI00129A1DA6|nr:alpha/beta hydrolase family protein [Nocardia sp. SYP-A9097]MRH86152.1 esterase family protein [Nocardia sp. SYP-A9097]
MRSVRKSGTVPAGRGRALLRRSVAGLALALVLPWGVAIGGGAAPAAASFDPAGEDFWVDSSMGPIKSRIFRAQDGNTQRVVYALDGLRARNDLSGWEIDTDISRVLPAWNINVVMPIGGQSSFYSDWMAPSNTNGQATTYAWETFLTRDLRNALAGRLGFNPRGNGVFGLSMGGSAALVMAAYHPDQFRYAASYSGYLNISAPGMREALRLALLDAGGFNIDSMWGPPWSELWLRNDPFVFAPLLRGNGTRLWISSGNGQRGPRDAVNSALDAYNLTNAAGLETVALANTRAFQARLDSLGPSNVVFDYTSEGVHSWKYWQDQVFKMLPDLSANLG